MEEAKYLEVSNQFPGTGFTAQMFFYIGSLNSATACRGSQIHGLSIQIFWERVYPAAVVSVHGV
jgi:hypothetical protein